MKWITKYASWLILTILMGSLMIYGFFQKEETSLLFYVGNEEGTERTEVFFAEDGCGYIFLPSYAEMDQVTVTFPSSQRLWLNGTEMKNGADCSAFFLNQKYQFQMGEETGVLQFCRSANVPALYIETASGSMEDIYADKEHEEIADIILYSPEGSVEYMDRSCILKGRGNSTWDKSKKPFLLRLSDEVGLLGMGEDADWILLANSYDDSNLHNKVLLDLANQACDEWTPQCEYVDLYLNGHYNDLYLLTEKVEIGENRLNIDVGAGDFLCTVDFVERMDTLENPFYTDNGRAIAICEPNVLSADAKGRIMELVNLQEQILLSQEDLTQQKLVDIDSWIQKYLVDEIAGNMDSDLSSSYFYYSDGVFYGGPVWDYDMALGSTIQNRYPRAFIAKNYVKYDQYTSQYYSTLFRNNSFFTRMSEIYESDFLPVLSQMIEQDIRQTADTIAVAHTMDTVRWTVRPSTQPETEPWNRYSNTADSIIEYLKEKTEFLNNTLIDGVPYCTIQFEHPMKTYYWTVSVPQGSVLEETDIVNTPLYPEVNSVIWGVNGTERIFDPTEPIMEDMVLRRR